MWSHLNVSVDYVVRRETFSGWNIPERLIVNHEIVLITRGVGRVQIENQQYEAKEGDLFYFYPGMKHSLQASVPPYMTFFGVHFTLPDNMDILPLSPVLHLKSPGRTETLFKLLLDAYQAEDSLSEWRQNLAAEQLICEILSSLKQESSPIELLRIQKTAAYIREHLFEPLSLQTLLSVAGSRKTAFLQSFRAVTGTTPLQYITSLRMEYAAGLLLETDLPVSKIAEQCGYADSFYFSRCFKKQFSLSPLQYRKLHARYTFSE